MSGKAPDTGKAQAFKGATALFCVVALSWWALDRVTKALVSDFPLGRVIVPDVLGLFEFKLVHNTGAAWGIFGSLTFLLGLFSAAVCAVIVYYFLRYRRHVARPFEIASLALVLAGGLGNAVDRLFLGYVVDFINPTFIDFPVFNVADIGVTCGIVAYFIAFWLDGRRFGDVLPEDSDGGKGENGEGDR